MYILIIYIHYSLITCTCIHDNIHSLPSPEVIISVYTHTYTFTTLWCLLNKWVYSIITLWHQQRACSTHNILPELLIRLSLSLPPPLAPALSLSHSLALARSLSLSLILSHTPSPSLSLSLSLPSDIDDGLAPRQTTCISLTRKSARARARSLSRALSHALSLYPITIDINDGLAPHKTSCWSCSSASLSLSLPPLTSLSLACIRSRSLSLSRSLFLALWRALSVCLITLWYRRRARSTLYPARDARLDCRLSLEVWLFRTLRTVYMTHSHKGRDLSIYGTWLDRIWDFTQSFMRQDSFRLPSVFGGVLS